MGCISSKFLATADLDGDISATHHVVSLTSTTYGVLNLDRSGDNHKDTKDGENEKQKQPPQLTHHISKVSKISPLPSSLFTPQSKKRLLAEEPREVINTWELMKDLSDEAPIWSPAMKPPTSLPPEFSNSPKKQKRRLVGKENVSPRENPNRVLRPFSSLANRQPSKLSIDVTKCSKVLEKDSGSLGSRRSLSPLFDPQLPASFERDAARVSLSEKSRMLLEKFEYRCPPSGERALVLYSTTLRGIRKTFEDCNLVRTAVEGYGVKVVERDISMDSGFREELRGLMVGNKKQQVRIPLLFVKGRLIGGAEEVVKLEEEGQLGLLMEGIEKKKDGSGCQVCGGMRFFMCRECNGSCKVLLGEGKEEEVVKCGECNENGLVHCQLCS